MKKAFWILGALITIAWLPQAARAQETTVAPPPAASPPASTGEFHAAKPPKGGTNPLFDMLGGPVRTNSANSFSTNNGGMTITSERIEYDYKELVIAFDEHVRVTDPQYTMTADRMLVFLQGTNQIKRIIAIGTVDVAQPPDRHAICDKAVYEHDTGSITMTGNPVLTRGADRVVGTKIIVFQNDQRVVVEGGGRVNLSPGTLKNREIKP